LIERENLFGYFAGAMVDYVIYTGYTIKLNWRIRMLRAMSFGLAMIAVMATVGQRTQAATKSTRRPPPWVA